MSSSISPASQYADPLEKLYTDNIPIKPFTKQAIKKPFVRKNGGELSAKKAKSVEQNFILKKESKCVTEALALPKDAGLDCLTKFASRFLNTGFESGGVIWRISWLHCRNQQFPIYDRHVHRRWFSLKDE